MAKDRDGGAAKTQAPGGATRDQQVLDELMAALPQGAQYVILQRQDERDPNVWAHSGKIPASDFTHEGVKEYYGGGRYRMQVVGEKGRFISPKVEFDIDPRFKPTKGPLAPSPIVPALTGTVPTDSMARIEKLLEMSVMLSLQGRNAPAAAITDPFEGAVKIATLMKDTHPAQGITSKEVLELIFKGMEIAGNKGGGDKSGFTALAEASSPLFGALAKNLEADAETKAARARLRLVPKTDATPPPPQTGETASMAPWREQVRPYIPYLVGWAKADKDPGLNAEWVIDQLPGDVAEAVEGEARKLTADQFAAMMMETYPELAQVAGWAQEFFKEVHASITAEISGEDA